MSFNQTMQAYERKDFMIEGDFLFVESCPANVVIYAQRGQYELTQGAQIKSNTLNGRVTVENRGEAGRVSLVVGFGEYVPPQIESLEVSAMPAVDIETMPSVEIETMPSVEIETMPPVEIAQGQKIEVSNLETISTQFSSSEVSMPHSFASNSARKRLFIKANIGNLNAVQVGAFPLYAGERLELETTAAINVTGESSDKIQFIEV
jgi:hypothetical protein